MVHAIIATYLCICLLKSAAALDDAVDANTLQFVHVLWRHGDRTPSSGTFPTDTKNNLSTWPEGWGELTKMGMQQQYALGKYLRERYVESGFLSQDYNASEIHVRSTSYNRTIMSALANLAGLYPPTQSHQWMKNLSWQPIPVHSAPKEEDPILWIDIDCPTAMNILHEVVLKSPDARKVEDDYAEFLQFLRNATGAPIPSFIDIWSIFDALNCEQIHQHVLPDWVTPTVFEKIKLLHDISTTFYFRDFRIQRLRGGLLFGDIASRMAAKAKTSSALMPNSLKYYAYSAHDDTLMALMANMGVYNGRNPEYASAIVIELHNISGSFVVKALYLNKTGSRSLVPLVVKGCGATEVAPYCSLDAFVALARTHTPDDWKAECGIVSPEARKLKVMTVVTIVLGVITFVLLVVVAVLIRRLRRGTLYSLMQPVT